LCCAFPYGKTGTKIDEQPTDSWGGWGVGYYKKQGHAQLWSSKKQSSKRGRKRRLTQERVAYAHTQGRIPSVTKTIPTSSDSGRREPVAAKAPPLWMDEWMDGWMVTRLRFVSLGSCPLPTTIVRLAACTILFIYNEVPVKFI